MTQVTEPSRPEELSAAACAEAAAWIARLHGADRTTEVEKGFRSWLAASAEHRAAFEMANEIWTGTERWPRPEAPTFVRWPRAGIVLTVPRVLLAIAVVATFAFFGVMFSLRDPVLATQIGEQRTVALEDGTRVSLNTATRIRVAYDEHVRSVELEQGEALFEIAKRPDWPFIVAAGDRRITALGTAFVVRRDKPDEFVVTLVEGEVSVSVAAPTSAVSGLLRSSSRASSAEAPRAGAVLLTAGERLTFAGGAAPRLDRPAVSQVTAWQRGQVIFDHTPLSRAIQEMNRYSIMQLAIDDPAVAALEVTGVFRSGDSVSFAQAVSESYQIELVQEPRRIRLRR